MSYQVENEVKFTKERQDTCRARPVLVPEESFDPGTGEVIENQQKLLV